MLIDLLVAVFFFLIGLEIKKGLKSTKIVIVPVIGALGGMLMPAILFLGLNPGSHVWATAMPTDIALALGVLSLLGNRVDSQVRLFLLTLAIADDLFSLIVLGLFYGDDLHPAKAISTLGAAAIGFIVPFSKKYLEKLIGILSPVSTYLIVPIIIITNIPLAINLESFSSKTTIALVIARTVGKIVGITIFSFFAIKIGGYSEISIKEIAGIGALAGMGMTVSLVIAEIAAQNATQLNEVRLGLFISALISGLAGYIWLKRTPAKR